MATARDRHYDTRSVLLVPGLVAAAALPQPCKKKTLTQARAKAKIALPRSKLSWLPAG